MPEPAARNIPDITTIQQDSISTALDFARRCKTVGPSLFLQYVEETFVPHMPRVLDQGVTAGSCRFVQFQDKGPELAGHLARLGTASLTLCVLWSGSLARTAQKMVSGSKAPENVVTGPGKHWQDIDKRMTRE